MKEQPKTLVIYHSADFDGLFCREIARRALASQGPTEFVGWDYGDPVPDVSGFNAIYMLDLCIEPLMDHPNLFWIDHHKTAIDKFKDRLIPGYQIDGVAACRLAYQWFFSEEGLPSKKAFIDRTVDEPLSVQLAGEYDIWDKRNPEAELFQHGLRSCPLGPMQWATLVSTGSTMLSFVGKLLDGGQAVAYATKMVNASVASRCAYTREWEGLRFLILNTQHKNSFAFDGFIKNEHQALMRYSFTGAQWDVSLYGVPRFPDIDLSVIAKKFGGGGHKQACGFRVSDISQLPL